MSHMSSFQEIRGIYLNKPLSFFDSFIENRVQPVIFHSGYSRVPLFQGNCIVLLMFWGKNALTAIHGHGGIEGTVKVIKGTIKEDKYRFTGTDIELISSKVHSPGEILSEDTGTIHAISNQNETWSVTLHIYDTNKNTLAGTVMYDPEGRRIGILNDLAKTTSWNEDPKAFRSIIPFDQHVQK
jgi:hypothetical protein